MEQSLERCRDLQREREREERKYEAKFGETQILTERQSKRQRLKDREIDKERQQMRETCSPSKGHLSRDCPRPMPWGRARLVTDGASCPPQWAASPRRVCVRLVPGCGPVSSSVLGTCAGWKEALND